MSKSSKHDKDSPQREHRLQVLSGIRRLVAAVSSVANAAGKKIAGIVRNSLSRTPNSSDLGETSKVPNRKRSPRGKTRIVAKTDCPPPDASVLAKLAGLKALSIRQPHAEAIMRGTKTTEYRSGPTRNRGRILIYASLGRDDPEYEAEMMAEYRITDIACDDLVRGVLIGTVELHNCDGGQWFLRQPERLETLVKPQKHPQPSWFNPF